MADTEDEQGKAGKLFENFVQASTCKGTLQAFNIMCRQLELDPLDHETFYSSLKARVTSWKAKALWSKLDKRTNHKEYKKGAACAGTKCLIIGGGPCGLRTAIELALLGAKVVVIEKRDTFSRNNVLHLWPYTIHDLRGLGAKKFYGKFCAGAIDHISIRQLQLMLLKIALLVAVEFHVNVEFVKLLEPPEDQENEGPGWRAELRPADHPVADFDFDVVVGADGRRNTLEGFKRKEFRGKLAIAITANFINRNTTAEAKVEEISGVAFIFNQKFFMDLKDETGIDLENIVYYRDNTHYFVMTAKKQSLLDKGVIINDYIDTEMLLNSTNVDQEALLGYAREAADYATHYQLPTLDFAMNHLGQPDVAMFDFTCMYASENAALVRERFGHQLLVALVGDSLLEPFWPMGTGCARGFLAAFDTAWMVKSWAQGRAPIEVLAERESLYRLLPQTTPANIAKDFDQYTVDPGTRYPNLNSNCVRPHQVRHLYINGELKACSLERAATVRRPVNLSRRESEVRPGRLQTWCQKQTDGYRGVSVCDLTSSWANGLALCALIHRFRPGLIDYDSLNEEDCAQNLQLAFDVSEREFGIKPFSTGKDLAGGQEPDKVTMVTYLSKFYELFRGTPLPPSDSRREGDANDNDSSHKPTRPVYKSFSFTQPRKRIPKDDKKLEENDPTYKRRRKICSYLEEATNFSSQSSSASKDGQELKENKVKSMATQLLAKFEERAPSCSLRRQRPQELDMQLCRNTAQRQAVNDIRMRRANTSHFTLHKQIETPQSKQEPAAPKQRTVGKVSLVVGARAETIASLYESDHRPKANSPPTSPGSFRRELGGSELCHACNRRVYVVERISAEGLFFHRECFRCDTCSASLSQGRHAFDSETGKLYCKLHFAQRTSGVKRERAFGLHMRNHGTDVQDGPETDGSSVGNSARQSPGTLGSLLRKSLSWPVHVTRAVCAVPRRLSCWLRGAAQATRVHLWAHAEDYGFLYELLSVGLPLMGIQMEVLLHMYAELERGADAAPGPGPLSPQTLVQWAQQQLGLTPT
ncbi:F-actin-monooxygenase MICAL2 isoform X7 [Alosa alosa]|uniref:F-actin-monooxygenase MICAL2 isoform X7 n=1 Tax=Alosa alosa TaxID=278164 RepID=UPI0020150C59|nr:F-actin-monooxygenase MICAL2 isoform X7 [Alosa alosa]